MRKGPIDFIAGSRPPNLPSRLYRIRRLSSSYEDDRIKLRDRAKDEIEFASKVACGIRFSPITSFGDLFEARPRINSAPIDEVYRFVNLFWDRLEDAPSIQRCMKRIGMEYHSKFSMTDFSKRIKLVDALRIFARSLATDTRDRTSAACLMERFEDQQMWQNYSDGGAGIAIELTKKSDSELRNDESGEEIRGDLPSQRTRSSPVTMPHIVLAATGYHFNHVSYSSVQPVITDLEILSYHPSSLTNQTDQIIAQMAFGISQHEFMKRFYFTKPIDFRDEREWRFIQAGVKPGFYPIVAYKLSGVLLGPRISPEDREFFVGICKGFGISVKRIRPSTSDYTFEAVEVD